MTYKDLEQFLNDAGVEWDVMDARNCGKDKERIKLYVEVDTDDGSNNKEQV